MSSPVCVILHFLSRTSATHSSRLSPPLLLPPSFSFGAYPSTFAFSCWLLYISSPHPLFVFLPLHRLPSKPPFTLSPGFSILIPLPAFLHKVQSSGVPRTSARLVKSRAIPWRPANLPSAFSPVAIFWNVPLSWILCAGALLLRVPQVYCHPSLPHFATPSARLQNPRTSLAKFASHIISGENLVIFSARTRSVAMMIGPRRFEQCSSGFQKFSIFHFRGDGI